MGPTVPVVMRPGNEASVMGGIRDARRRWSDRAELWGVTASLTTKAVNSGLELTMETLDTAP
jgi:hypothetical protein